MSLDPSELIPQESGTFCSPAYLTCSQQPCSQEMPQCIINQHPVNGSRFWHGLITVTDYKGYSPGVYDGPSTNSLPLGRFRTTKRLEIEHRPTKVIAKFPNSWRETLSPLKENSNSKAWTLTPLRGVRIREPQKLSYAQLDSFPRPFSRPVFHNSSMRFMSIADMVCLCPILFCSIWSRLAQTGGRATKRGIQSLPQAGSMCS